MLLFSFTPWLWPDGIGLLTANRFVLLTLDELERLKGIIREARTRLDEIIMALPEALPPTEDARLTRRPAPGRHVQIVYSNDPGFSKFFFQHYGVALLLFFEGGD